MKPEMKLRDYQTRFVQDIKDALLTKDSVVAIAPVGSGKLVSLVNLAVYNLTGRVLILTSRIETLRHIQEFLGMYKADCEIFCDSFGKVKPSSDKKIAIGTVQTVSHYVLNDETCFGSFDFIVVDEFSGYDNQNNKSESFKIVKQAYPKAKIIYFSTVKHNPDDIVEMVVSDEA